MFEDFNYNQFNKYILLDENMEFYEEDELEDNLSKSQQAKQQKPMKTLPSQIGVDDEEEKIHLNEQALLESIKDSFNHSQFDIDTEQEKKQAYDAEQKARIAREIEENEQRIY